MTVTEERWGLRVQRSSFQGGHFRCRRQGGRGEGVGAGGGVSFSVHFIPFLMVPF